MFADRGPLWSFWKSHFWDVGKCTDLGTESPWYLQQKGGSRNCANRKTDRQTNTARLRVRGEFRGWEIGPQQGDRVSEGQKQQFLVVIRGEKRTMYERPYTDGNELASLALFSLLLYYFFLNANGRKKG